jgi:hypothetical protein
MRLGRAVFFANDVIEDDAVLAVVAASLSVLERRRASVGALRLSARSLAFAAASPHPSIAQPAARLERWLAATSVGSGADRPSGTP